MSMVEFTDQFACLLDKIIKESKPGHTIGLATAVGIKGRSPRPLGSQIFFNAEEQSGGLISGGCIDDAVLSDGLDRMGQKQAEILIYGEGGHYIDLRMPCGSAVHVLHDSQWSEAMIEMIMTGQKNRTPLILHYDHETGEKTVTQTQTRSTQEDFIARWSDPQYGRFLGYEKLILPKYRLHIAGENNPVTPFLTQFAKSMGFDVIISDRLGDHESLDPWSAFVTLIHEHSHEIPLLGHALDKDAFFVGALGSTKTHQTRRELLALDGLKPSALDRIEGPVGLDIGAATPAEIALSIMGSITLHLRKPHFPDGRKARLQVFSDMRVLSQ